MRALDACSLALIMYAATASATRAAQGTSGPSAAKGRFFAVEAVSADRERFIADWDRPGPHASLHVDEHIRPGGSATVLVLFKDCRIDAHGLCHVSAVFSRVGPDGAVMGPARAQLWDRAPLGPEVFMRGTGAATFTFAPKQPAGRYTLKAAVTDAVAGTTFTLVVPIIYG